MKYDPRYHLTTDQLADLMGVPATNLSGRFKNTDVRPLGNITIGGRKLSIYDRFAAIEWVDSQREKAVEKPGEIVPPSDINLMQRKPYRPSAQMRINMDLTAGVYPHRLYTPDGVGNDHNYGGRA